MEFPRCLVPATQQTALYPDWRMESPHLNRTRIVTGLVLLSGVAGLIYEVVWIRMFAIGLGSTAQAMSTVLGVYLTGLSVGSLAAGKLAARHSENCLRLYGIAEIGTGFYALTIPWLVRETEPAVRLLYEMDSHAVFGIALIRAILGASILIPATVFIGATLPFLAGWAFKGTPANADRLVGVFYSVNLAGASFGALLSGFVLLPGLGFTSSLEL